MPIRKSVLPPAGDAELIRHWGWRPDWTRERRCWWWYATFESDAEVQGLAADARAAIRPDAPVDVVPPRWLHLTIAEVGYEDVLPRRLAYECARRANERLADQAPIDLQVDPVGTMPGAVVLPVSGAGLAGVYDGLVAAVRETLPEQPEGRPFAPHVSIAYVARDCRPAEVLDETHADRCATGRSRLSRVSLVEVTRERSHYRWTPRCQAPLRALPQRHLRAVDER
jgi:2'-5' RNA ligase